eukprot:gene17471-biopygen1713
MRRGSHSYHQPTNPGWLRCDAARFPCHAEYIRDGDPYGFPNTYSLATAWWWRCDAALTGHPPRKMKDGADATRASHGTIGGRPEVVAMRRGLFCVCVAASGSLGDAVTR